MISVVVPVYNVQDYLDRCLESVVNQTFKDFEILLINDGSTDGSAEKCLEWQKRDSRIIYVSKKNERLGPTRNFGVKLAKYDYIAFLDSDDWWDKNMLRSLYDTMRKTDADIVSCDFYYAYASLNGESENYILQKHWIFKESMTPIEVDKNRDMIYRMRYSVWAKLFKKDLFEKYHIKQPDFDYEDSAVVHYMIAKSNLVAHVKEGLYYYRSNRSGRITSNFKFTESMCFCLDTMLQSFITNNLFELYRSELKRLSKDMIRMVINQAESMQEQVTKKEYQEVRDKLIRKLYSYFPELTGSEKRSFVILGSINLRNISRGLCWELEKIERHYCFSSIVSIFSEPYYADIDHSNRFRKKWLSSDFYKDFVKEIKKMKKDDYLMIDFLEERFDIGKYRNTYFTLSDAFQEISEQVEFEYFYEKIERDDPKMFKLWKEKCDLLIELLKENIPQENIILVETKLSEYKGEYGREEKFEGVSDIRKINKILEQYYEYFKKKLPNIKLFEFKDSSLYFSDKKFRFGCYPYHLNDCFFSEAAETIMNNLEDKI